MVECVDICKAESILLGLRHKISSVDGALHVVADSTNLKNLHSRTDFRLKRAVRAALLNDCSAVSKVLKLPNVRGLLDVTLVRKKVEYILHKRPEMSTFQ